RSTSPNARSNSALTCCVTRPSKSRRTKRGFLYRGAYQSSMQLSVVVPTLNGRRQLVACLDALAATAPESEVIVVNGPSADGTTGMVRGREDVDVLVEVADRNLNVVRNAGLEAATGDRIALVGNDYTVEPEWLAALDRGFDGARPLPRSHALAEGYPHPDGSTIGAVTGPTRSSERGGP